MLPTRPAHAIPLRLLGFSAMFVAAALTIGAGQTAPAKPAAAQPKPQVTPVQERPRLLVFSKTAGFRHQSIPDGIKAIRALLSDRYEIDATEDAAVFSADNLKRYRALVFMSTTGDILNDAQQAALEGYIHAGGGYAGVHSAADTEHTWPWYGELVGAYFKTHPAIQDAMVRVEDQTHRSTRMLPAQWPRHDEWYVYTSNPRSRVKVLANLDDSTITGANMDGDHPIAWYHEFQGGRAWYTGGGHTSESYAEPLFLKHIEGGILWAAGASDDAVAPTKKVDAKQP
ncbi:MAG: ThuA domain-containing protein [Planctomycetota bacterium]